MLTEAQNINLLEPSRTYSGPSRAFRSSLSLLGTDTGGPGRPPGNTGKQYETVGRCDFDTFVVGSLYEFVIILEDFTPTRSTSRGATCAKWIAFFLYNP